MITAWLAITVAIVASITIGQRPGRGQQEERVVDRLGIADRQRPLAEIVQHQAGSTKNVQVSLDRMRAEMAHVGIQRLGTGDAQTPRPQHDESDQPVYWMHKADRVAGLKSPAARTDAARSVCTAEIADDSEPHRHDRAEDAADAAGAAPLHREQHRQDHHHLIGST